MGLHKAVKAYIAKNAAKGGKARAANNSKRKLSEWGKMGGRPRKVQSQRKGKVN